MLGIFTEPSSDTLFILCVLMFLAGLLTANLPWPRRNRRAEELAAELEEMRAENEHLADALDSHDTGTAVADLQRKLDMQADELDRERAARTMAEEAVRRREQQLEEFEGREYADDERVAELEDQLHQALRDHDAARAEVHSLLQRFESDAHATHSREVESATLQKLLEDECDARQRLEEEHSRLVELAQAGQGEISELRQLLESEQEARQRLEEKYGGANEVLHSSQNEAATLRQQLIEQQHVSRQLQVSLDELRDQKSQSSTAELEQARRERDALQLELGEARQHFHQERADLVRTLESRQSRINQLMIDLDSAQDGVSTLSQSRADLDQELSALRLRLAQAEEKSGQVQHLQVEYQTLAGQLTESRRKRVAAEEMVAGLTHELETLRASMQVAEDEHVRLRSQLEQEGSTRLASLRSEADQRSMVISSLQRELSELRETVEKERETTLRHQQQAALQETRAAQLRHEADDKVAVIADLQKQLAEARARSGEQTTLLQKEVLELREKVETYEAQVTLHDTRVAQLRHEAEEKVGIVAQLQRQIAEQRTMVEQHATESTLAQQKAAEFATLAKQREEEVAGLRSLLASQGTHRSELESQIVTLQRQVEQHAVEHARAHEEVASLRLLLDEQREAKRHHEEQYAALHTQLRDKNAEYVEVLNERDSARALLSDERSRRENGDQQHQLLEKQLNQLRTDLAHAQTRASEERLKLESTVQQREGLVGQLTRERDLAQAELKREQDSRESVQHLLEQRRRELDAIQSELVETRTSADRRIGEVEQRIHVREATVAQLQRECDALKGKLASEIESRKAAVSAHEQSLDDARRVSRELEKADALLEERLYLAQRLEEREARLHDLETENRSLKKQLGTQPSRVAASPESTMDAILRMQRRAAEEDSVIRKERRSA